MHKASSAIAAWKMETVYVLEHRSDGRRTLIIETLQDLVACYNCTIFLAGGYFVYGLPTKNYELSSIWQTFRQYITDIPYSHVKYKILQ